MLAIKKRDAENKCQQVGKIFKLDLTVSRENRFEERLSGIIRQAVKRLHERMRAAYFRGRLNDYLAKIGLGTEIEAETGEISLPGAILEASRTLEAKIKKSRRKGYLKDYLQHINMVDLLFSSDTFPAYGKQRQKAQRFGLCCLATTGSGVLGVPRSKCHLSLVT